MLYLIKLAPVKYIWSSNLKLEVTQDILYEVVCKTAAEKCFDFFVDIFFASKANRGQSYSLLPEVMTDRLLCCLPWLFLFKITILKRGCVCLFNKNKDPSTSLRLCIVTYVKARAVSTA